MRLSIIQIVKLNSITIFLCMSILLVRCANSDRECDQNFEQNFYCNFHYSVLQCQEVLQDISFETPFNFYIKIAMSENDFRKFIIDNHFYTKEDVDTVLIKKKFTIDEYKYFFTLNTLNEERNESMKSIKGKISFWNEIKDEYPLKVYSNEHLIKNNFIIINNKKMKFYGKFSCVFINNSMYLLIENREF